jgi:hypothetical protein
MATPGRNPDDAPKQVFWFNVYAAFITSGRTGVRVGRYEGPDYDSTLARALKFAQTFALVNRQWVSDVWTSFGGVTP